MDQKETVRIGYERAAGAYLAARPKESPDIAALEQLTRRLPAGALILDAGCGAGMPIAQRLSQSFHVVGVDFSERQLALAARHAPRAALACQDLTRLGLKPVAFDAICSYYAIIHIPRGQHLGVFVDFHRLLRPGGFVFLCLGAVDLEDDFDDNFYGVRMYWSHFDAPTNLQMLERVGFDILWVEVINDSLGDEEVVGGHLFVLAQKRAA